MDLLDNLDKKIDQYIKENLEFKEQLTTNRGLTYIKKEM